MDSEDKKIEKDFSGSKFNEDIFSNTVRAGKRTYFFDVKKTRGDELYLTITESKKKFKEDGSFHYEKHKIFLYQEDFDKFGNTLNEMFDYIANNQTEKEQEVKKVDQSDDLIAKDEPTTKDFTDIDFEDI